MREIGVRQLKATLSEVLRAVSAGEPVRVTMHGRPIAEIIPPRSVSIEERLDELAAQGRLTRATRPLQPAPARYPSRTGRSGAEMIFAEREEERP